MDYKMEAITRINRSLDYREGIFCGTDTSIFATHLVCPKRMQALRFAKKFHFQIWLELHNRAAFPKHHEWFATCSQSSWNFNIISFCFFVPRSKKCSYIKITLYQNTGSIPTCEQWFRVAVSADMSWNLRLNVRASGHVHGRVSVRGPHTCHVSL